MATMTEQPKSIRAEQVRQNRQLMREARRANEQRRLAAEREATIRLSYRAARRGAVFSLFHLDIRYWQLRSCGWDVLAINAAGETIWAVDANGDPCDPEESVVWQWWRGLHWQERRKVREMSLADKRQQRAERRRIQAG